MISREKLIEHFENVVQFEKDIKKEYDGFIEKLNDETTLEKLKSIRDWEIEHIKLTQRLVEVVSLLPT